MDATEQPRRLLGLLLIEMGLISEELLLNALLEQERSGKLLGEILIAHGYVTRLAIQDALARQRGVLLQPDPGFGGGLRGELVRREMRREQPVKRLESARQDTDIAEPEQQIAGAHNRRDTPERDLSAEVRRLAEELDRQAARLTELERELANARGELAEARPPSAVRVGTARLGVGDSSPSARNLSDPFLVNVGRARVHMAARRAALRRRTVLPTHREPDGAPRRRRAHDVP